MINCPACAHQFDFCMHTGCPVCWKIPTKELESELKSLRAQVTQLQEHNTKEVERRRRIEAKLNLQDRLGGLCIRALGKWGEESQLEMAVEECAELIVSIKHLRRGRVGVVTMLEEAADTYITVSQLRLLAPTAVDQLVGEKLDRLEKLLEAPNA